MNLGAKKAKKKGLLEGRRVDSSRSLVIEYVCRTKSARRDHVGLCQMLNRAGTVQEPFRESRKPDGFGPGPKRF